MSDFTPITPLNEAAAAAEAAAQPAGRAPVLYMQPSHDPLAHAQDAVDYKAALGDRLTVIRIPQSSHAAIAEQPVFIASEIAAWARRILP